MQSPKLSQGQKLNLEFKQLQKKSLYRFWGISAVGIFLGFKLVDLIFYDENYYINVRERLEDEFWKERGEPVLLQPKIVKSPVDGRTRKSWIQLVLPADQIIKSNFQ